MKTQDVQEDRPDVIEEHVDRCRMTDFLRRQGHWAAWYEDPEGSLFCICRSDGKVPRFVGYLYGYFFNRPLDGPRHANLIDKLDKHPPMRALV